jgi:hypothetical protein
MYKPQEIGYNRLYNPATASLNNFSSGQTAGSVANTDSAFFVALIGW